VIGIVDYGMGNLGSVINALQFLDEEAIIISRPENIADCRALIVPGVGAFGDCAAHLQKSNFDNQLKEWISSGKPLMGICLGLQILFDESEESPGTKGLGIFSGTVKKFQLPKQLKVPQIGWNKLFIKNKSCPMFKNINDEDYFYLVHSYYVYSDDKAIIAGETDYGVKYCSCVWKENIFATQFHPEKSQKVGLIMLKNFCDWSNTF